MSHKRIRQREFVIDIYGPIFFDEYGFTIKFDLDGLLSEELFNSHTNKLEKLKTLKIAQETASFAAGELWKIATTEFKGKPEYYQQVLHIAEMINNKIKKKKS